MSYGWVIFIGVIAFFVIVIGILLITGFPIKETLCEEFGIRYDDTSEPKTSETTRRNIGIALICVGIILVVAFVWGSLVLPNKSSSGVDRKCGYCGEEGAYYKFGSYYYCEDCYDGLVDAKDRVENN